MPNTPLDTSETYDPFMDDGDNFMKTAETLTPKELDEVQQMIYTHKMLELLSMGQPGKYIFRQNKIPANISRYIPDGSEVELRDGLVTIKVFNPLNPKDQKKLASLKLHEGFVSIFGYNDSGNA